MRGHLVKFLLFELQIALRFTDSDKGVFNCLVSMTGMTHPQEILDLDRQTGKLDFRLTCSNFPSSYILVKLVTYHIISRPLGISHSHRQAGY